MRLWQTQREIAGRAARARAVEMDAIVRGTAAPPPFVEPLRLPWPEGWAPGQVWLRWKVDPGLANGAGTTFGGYLAALADHALGLATHSVLGEGEGFTTYELQVHYFRPVISGEVAIEAKVVHRGRSRVHAEVVFTDEAGRIAGKATATQVVLGETKVVSGETSLGASHPPPLASEETSADT